MQGQSEAAIDRVSKLILWLFIAFNLMISATLLFDPGQIDAQYQGGPLTPTRLFQWFSVASWHLFMVAVTIISLAMSRARERRWLHLANAGFYLWDALTQWFYWGAAVGVEAKTLAINVGVSAAVAALMALVWWRERRPSEARSRTTA